MPLYVGTDAKGLGAGLSGRIEGLEQMTQQTKEGLVASRTWITRGKPGGFTWREQCWTVADADTDGGRYLRRATAAEARYLNRTYR